MELCISIEKGDIRFLQNLGKSMLEYMIVVTYQMTVIFIPLTSEC